MELKTDSVEALYAAVLGKKANGKRIEDTPIVTITDSDQDEEESAPMPSNPGSSSGSQIMWFDPAHKTYVRFGSTKQSLQVATMSFRLAQFGEELPQVTEMPNM